MADDVKIIYGPVNKVFPQAKKLVLAGYSLFGQEGVAREGCDDDVRMYFVRPPQPKTGLSLVPDPEEDYISSRTA